jgi:hypothetical protein
MRVSASTERFRPKASGVGGAGLKAGALALLLAGCVFLTACPPEGGELFPQARGDGASLSTTQSEGDTLSITREGVTLRARGRWSVSDADTSVILEAGNANTEPATIDFGRSELLNDVSKSRLSLRSVSRETVGGGPVFLPDRTAKIEGGQEAKFVLEFKMDSADGRSGVERNVLGQTVTLRVPVEIQTATPVDFVFGFKYAERRR